MRLPYFLHACVSLRLCFVDLSMNYFKLSRGRRPEEMGFLARAIDIRAGAGHTSVVLMRLYGADCYHIAWDGSPSYI